MGKEENKKSDICIFCEDEHFTESFEKDGFKFFRCPRCGNYKIKDDNKKNIIDILENHKKSFVENERKQRIFTIYCSFKMHEKSNDLNENDFIEIDESLIKNFIENCRFIDVDEQIDNFLYWICTENESEDKLLSEYNDDFFNGLKPFIIYAWFGCLNVTAFEHLLELLKEDGFLKIKENTNLSEKDYMSFETKSVLAPTLKAYQHYAELKKGKKASNKAFLALQFKGKLNETFKEKIKNAVKKTGFILQTVDEQPTAGLIDNKIRLDIRNSRFIIADLTDGNKGAYWEAGFAEGLGKEVIYMCEERIMKSRSIKRKPHFDVNHHQCIPWDENNFEDALKKLKDTIRYTFPDAEQKD